MNQITAIDYGMRTHLDLPYETALEQSDSRPES
jgi:hypothetical protein